MGLRALFIDEKSKNRLAEMGGSGNILLNK